MTFHAFLESDTCVRLGWTLVHSLWQITILGALAAVTIACFRSRTQWRYAVVYSALLLMAVVPVATYLVVTPPTSETPPIAMTPLEPRVRPVESLEPVEPSIVELEVDVTRNGSSLSAASLDTSELSGESEILAPEPEPEPEPTPTARSTEPVPSLAHRATRAPAWLAPFWLTGVVLLAFRHLGGWVLSRRLLCTASPLEHIELQRRLEGLMHKMGVRRAVRLLESTLTDTPMVLGVIRPALIVPVSLVTGLSPTQWEAILAHELAHIRRHDYLMNLVQIVIETLLFYHPAVWWVSRCIRAERENCCDDMAAAYCGSPVVLAEGLAAIEATRRKNVSTDLAVAAVGSQDSTLRRVRRILGFSDANPQRGHTWLAGLLILTLLFIVGVVGHRAGAQADGVPQDTRAEGEEGEKDETNSRPELAADAVSKILPLHRNGSISLRMKSTAGGRNGIVQLRWIGFSKTKGVLRAELLTQLISYPKGKWLVTLDLLSSDDEHAKPLASADAIFENSGIVISEPSTSTRFIRWHLGSDRLAEQATHFRVTLSPSIEPGVRQTLPLLDGTPIPFRLEPTWRGQGPTATFFEISLTTKSGKLQADLRGLVESWPKADWQVVVDLLSSDSNAKPIASAEATLVNSGVCVSQPNLVDRELHLALGDQSLLREAVAVRVSLIPSVEQASAPPVDVKGQVLDTEGEPIEALLVVRTPDGLFSPTIATDSKGRFTIPSCPSTRVAMLAFTQDGGFGPVARMVDASEDMEPLTQRLTAKRELRVHATDQFDEPVAPGGLRIGLPLIDAKDEEEPYFWLSSQHEGLLAGVLPKTVLDARGRFAWDAAPDGPLALQISGLNHVKTEVLVPTDSDGRVSVVMKRPVARLVPNTRLERGGPATSTKIQLFPEVDHAIRFHPGRGLIEIYENRPEYVYRITAEGYVPMTHKVLLKDVLEISYYPITTRDGNIEYRPSRRPIGDSNAAIAATPVPSPWKARSHGTTALRIAAPFAPICLTPSGEPAVDADVCVQGYGEFGNNYRTPIVNNGRANTTFGTDERGRAIIPAYIAKAGMTDRPAVGIVILHDSGYKILTRARFATAERITLEPWGRITGQYTVNGKPPKGQRLSLTAEPHEDKTIREIFRVDAQQTTDAKGRFTFDRLLPGTYHVTSRDKMETIKVKPGESVTVNFEIAAASHPAPPLPNKVYRVRRATMDRFLQPLFTNQSMRKVRRLTLGGWVNIAKSFAQRAGPFERALSYRMVQTEDGDYMEARCKWERAIMLVRVTFNETGDRVTGFWLARDEEGPTPKGFKRGGYILGKPMMKIAGLDENASSNLHDLSAHVTLVNENGRPKDPPLHTTLWKRTLDPTAHAYSSAGLIEDLDGVKWQYISNVWSADHTFSDLSAGVYRLTAYYHGVAIVSDPFRVTGSPAWVDIPFTIPDSQRTTYRISARLIDKGSNEPLGLFQPFYKLYRTGFQRRHLRYDNNYDNSTPEEGYVCELLPGVYQVDVYGAWHSIGKRSRAMARPTRFSFEVTEDGPHEFTFDIPSYSFAEEDDEVAKRWPNVVEGVVRTADGEPVEGADVHVHGRPEERAWTTTDANGRYSLRFAPEIYTSAIDAARMIEHNQYYSNVSVDVEKQGYVEANFARHGRLAVVEEAPLDKNGNPLAPESFVVRGEPFHDINFTIVPAARLDVKFFRDQDGKPVDHQLSLVNADNRKQSCYLSAANYKGVPTVGRWRLHPGIFSFDSSLSPVISFPTPGSYHASLQAVEIPEEERSVPSKKLRLTLLSLIDPNGQEVAPSPQTHIMVDGKREPLHSPEKSPRKSKSPEAVPFAPIGLTPR